MHFGTSCFCIDGVPETLLLLHTIWFSISILCDSEEVFLNWVVRVVYFGISFQYKVHILIFARRRWWKVRWRSMRFLSRTLWHPWRTCPRCSSVQGGACLVSISVKSIWSKISCTPAHTGSWSCRIGQCRSCGITIFDSVVTIIRSAISTFRVFLPRKYEFLDVN